MEPAAVTGLFGCRDGGALASGNPKRIGRRLVNKMIGRKIASKLYLR